MKDGMQGPEPGISRIPGFLFRQIPSQQNSHPISRKIAKVTYTIENASWTVPVETVWLADTAAKGTPVSAYNSPVVIQTDILWSGTSGESGQKESLDLGLLFDLDEFPTIDSMLTGSKFWIAGHPINSPLYLSEMDSDYYLTLEHAQEYLEST